LKRTIVLLAVLLTLGLTASACGGAEPTATPPLPTRTALPATNTPLPPTDTPPPATDTPLPPTVTPPAAEATPTQTVALTLGEEQYRNGANGFAIAYPQGWVHYAFADGSRVLFHAGGQSVEELFGGSAPPQDPIVMVTGGPINDVFDGQLQGATSAQEVLDILLSWISDYEGLQIGEPQTLIVAGQQALAVDVTWTLGDLGMAGRNVALEDGDRVITIQAIGTAEDWSAFLPTLEAMVDSLVLFAPALSRYELTGEYSAEGYTIAYPEGWQTQTEGTTTFIFQSPEVLAETVPSVPVVQIDAGPLRDILDGIASQATDATEIVAAVGEARRAEHAEARLGDIQQITGGDAPAAATSILWLEGDTPAMAVIYAAQKDEWAIIIEAQGTVESWQDFAPVFGEMIESLTLGEPQASGEIDWTDPASVVQAIFTAAQTEDFSRLPELCDPLGEHDGDTDAICNITADHPDKDTFVAAFAKARLNGEPTISGNRAEVPFLFGPNGDQEETMTLILRDGKWYLLGF